MNEFQGAPTHILVVDDRPDDLRALKSTLEEPDYDIIPACSGPEALRRAREQDVSMILLDAATGGVNCFELARRLRQSEETHDIPILFILAVSTDLREIKKAYELGAVDCLVKPLDPGIVRKKVAVLAELAHQREEIRGHRRREDKLRLAEARVATDRRYHKLIEGIDHAIGWTLDERLRFTFVSKRAEEILGFARKEFLEADFLEKHLEPEARDDVLDTLRAFLAGEMDGRDLMLGHGLMSADDRVLWFHSGLSRTLDDENRPEIHGVSVDVTQLKRAESAQALLADAARIVSDLRDYHEALPRLARRIVASIGDWCVIDEIADGGRLVEVGAAHVDPSREASVRALERRCDLDKPREIGPVHVARTGTVQLFERVSDGRWLADALGARQTTMVAELGGSACMFVPLTARARTLGVMSLVATRPQRRFDLDDLALADDIGRRVGTAIDNARLFEEAERGRIERENLLAIVSHDLRSPLASVVASATLLEEIGADEVERVHKYAKMILRSAKRMDRLIGDLSDLAQLQSGTLSVEQQPFDAASLIRESVDAQQPIAEEKGIRLEAQIGDSNPVYGDRDRVQQVLTNLLGNAIKFTPAGGAVTVRMSCNKGEALFAVADNGPGISEAELPRVWGRFWQGNRTAHTGVGLGLFIAKGLVEAHGGRIWVESKLEVGTTFYFVLPTCSREVGRGGADLASS